MIKIITIIILLSISSFAMDVQELIKKIENNLNGKTLYIKMTMIVQTKRTKRTMVMESWGEGTKKSFIKILYPKKDKGITFLKLDNNMWQYVPRIEKVIKIPASMMLQSWMGSDFSNDDLVKESSLSDDYDCKLKSEDEKLYKLELIPKEDSAVVWGKIEMSVSKKYLIPMSAKYFDEDDILVRVLEYKDIKKFKDRFYPTYWEMTPKLEEKAGHKTILIVEELVFDEEIKSSYFTKRALKRYSK
ncbi:MAG: outer membrane lipoprotein-sorting protein [Arcobacteraceae bacterium]|nr:outer membrane lipoprotein-sorting protein [Arcobacteraceae bacterium]